MRDEVPSPIRRWCGTQLIESGEDQETNPGIYGRALAQWLAEKLPAFGWRVNGCIAEDFGRLVEVEDSKFRLFVACASGHDGVDSWQAFTFVEGGGLLGVFAGAEKQQLADRLLAKGEAGQHAAPGGVAEGTKHDVQLGRIILNHVVEYGDAKFDCQPSG